MCINYTRDEIKEAQSTAAFLPVNANNKNNSSSTEKESQKVANLLTELILISSFIKGKEIRTPKGKEETFRIITGETIDQEGWSTIQHPSDSDLFSIPQNRPGSSHHLSSV